MVIDKTEPMIYSYTKRQLLVLFILLDRRKNHLHEINPKSSKPSYQVNQGQLDVNVQSRVVQRVCLYLYTRLDKLGGVCWPRPWVSYSGLL